MTKGLETEDRRTSVLDAFASAAPRDRETLPAMPMGGALIERATGAQAVAVHRDEAVVLQKLKTIGAAAGQDWYYRFPVRNRRENRQDWIEGPSIKLANDLARIYGNCEVDTRVVDVGNEWMIYARFTDIETGFTMTRPFQQRKQQGSIGGGDDARALDIALQIGVSKAIRNVVVNALQTFADFAFEEARNALVDRIGKNLDGYRERIVGRLADKAIDLKRVETVIGRIAADWLAPDVARVIAMVKAIEDGMATLDDTFPALDRPAAGEGGKAKPDGVEVFAKGGQAGKRTEAAQEQEASAQHDDQASPPAQDTPPTPQDTAAADAPKPNAEKIALLERLRPKARKGTNALRLALRGLTEADEALLADKDHDDLGGIAEEADRKAEQGNASQGR